MDFQKGKKDKQKQFYDEKYCCSIFDRNKLAAQETYEGSELDAFQKCKGKYKEINMIDEFGDGMQFGKGSCNKLQEKE
ncbi:hypothetical protein ACGFZ1_16625 [Bacillus velezensis]